MECKKGSDGLLWENRAYYEFTTTSISFSSPYTYPEESLTVPTANYHLIINAMNIVFNKSQKDVCSVKQNNNNSIVLEVIVNTTAMIVMHDTQLPPWCSMSLVVLASLPAQSTPLPPSNHRGPVANCRARSQHLRASVLQTSLTRLKVDYLRTCL